MKSKVFSLMPRAVFRAAYTYVGVLLVWGLAGCKVKTSPPELTGISPTTAYVGQEIVLTGRLFGSDAVVMFANATTSVQGRIITGSDQSLRVTVPVMAPGQISVRVQNAQGTSDPLPLTVEQPAPTLANATPTNALPGQTVVVTGQYLNQVTEVRFGQTPATIQDSTDTKLTLTVPATVARGKTYILINTKGGWVQIPFIVSATPVIKSIVPIRVSAGSELLIRGSNLTDGVVTIGTAATNRALTTVQDTLIRTIVPEGAPTARVTVTVFDNLVATSTDTLRVIQPPAISLLSAKEGMAGDKLTISGPNLGEISTLAFNTVPVPFRKVSATELETTLPALGASGSYTVSVSGVGGKATFAEPFLYFTAPGSFTFSPARQLPGQSVTLSGTNLYRISDVLLNGQPTVITARNEGSSVQVSIPATATSGLLTAVNRAGKANSTTPLIVVQKGTITDVLPIKARPGEQVVIRGTFLYNAAIYFTGSASAAAKSGKNTDAEQWVLVPADAQTGPIRVVDALGTELTTPTFTVVRLATVSGFSPTTAKVGYELTLTGQNLATVTAVNLNGGTLPATFRVSGNSLIVTVPAGAAVGQICVTNDAGTSCSSGNFTPSK